MNPHQNDTATADHQETMEQRQSIASKVNFRFLLAPTSFVVRQQDLVVQQQHSPSGASMEGSGRKSKEGNQWTQASKAWNNIAANQSAATSAGVRTTSSTLHTTSSSNSDSSDSTGSESRQMLRLPPSLSITGDQAAAVHGGGSEMVQLVPGSCAICLNSYQAGQQVSWSSAKHSASTPFCCTHAFHTDCVVRYAESCVQRQWQNFRSNTIDAASNKRGVVECPLCRGPFVEWARPPHTTSSHGG